MPNLKKLKNFLYETKTGNIISCLLAFMFMYGIIEVVNTTNQKEEKVVIQCPEDYSNTDIGLEDQKKAREYWTVNFSKDNPNASLTDFAKARARFYIDNNCNETLSSYYESEAKENETEEEKVIREAIQQEMRDQSMENLIEALKDERQ